MSSQSNITRFFNSRKRAASSSAPSRSKLLILEAQSAAKPKQQIAVEATPLHPPPEATQLGAKEVQDAPKKGKVVRSLDFNDLKKRIAANPTARDKLKSSLDRFQKLDAKLKIKPFDGALEIELPQSPIKKPIYSSPLKSPIKSPVKSCTQSPSKARVSLKFETEKEDLALPQSYQLLHASFKAMDVAACMLENRKEKVTLSKVTTAVEQITRMNFGRDKLGQIKTVDPDSVELKILKDDLELEMSFTKDAQGKSWSCLANREKGFKSKLIDLVKQYHQDFLAQLRPPLHIPSDKVMRWHPEFEPNMVPAIKPAALPESNSKKFYTASEVLDANSWLKSNTRVAQALAKLQSEVQSEDAAPSKEEEEPLNPSLRGLPAALLAKVRQKQAEKARLASLTITRPSDKEEQHRRLERLPVMAKYIRNIFVSEKKSVLRQEVLFEKLSNCFPFPLTNDEYEKHIELIIKGAPHWVEKITLRKDVFVRVIKRVEFEQLQKTLETMIQSNV